MIGISGKAFFCNFRNKNYQISFWPNNIFPFANTNFTLFVMFSLPSLFSAGLAELESGRLKGPGF